MILDIIDLKKKYNFKKLDINDMINHKFEKVIKNKQPKEALWF